MILPSSMYQAYLVLIPKPEKDLSNCASYRPIFLLCYDLKILNKILVTRMSAVSSTICHSDGAGQRHWP